MGGGAFRSTANDYTNFLPSCKANLEKKIVKKVDKFIRVL
jgi:hypothetical protein